MQHGGWRVAGECTTPVPRARRVHCYAARPVPLQALSPCREGSGTPRARVPAEAATAWLRPGPLFELTPALKGAAKVRAVLASSRYAASVRCGRRILVVPSLYL